MKISEKMIAPCGLNCAVCSEALRKEKPCCGCRIDGKDKSDFCANRCFVVQCKILPTLADGFCDACPHYPCEEVREKEERYTSAYPEYESPMENLAFIRENGIDEFLSREEKRWTCEACGGIICVHDGKCASCGRSRS